MSDGQPTTRTVISAEPGWYRLTYWSDENGDGFHQEPVIAWIVQMEASPQLNHSDPKRRYYRDSVFVTTLPVTADHSFHTDDYDWNLKGPDGAVRSPDDRTYESLQAALLAERALRSQGKELS